MTTQQNDTAALTDEQLDAASGEPHYTDWVGFRLIAPGSARSAQVASMMAQVPLNRACSVPTNATRVALRGES